MENFGCRATQADGAAIERELLEKGVTRAPEAASAEVVVLNTCTVTTSADQDARAAVRRIHHQNPKAKIIVTGCYAQRAPTEIAALPGVSLVVGNSHKARLAELVLESTGHSFVPLAALENARHSNGRPPAEIIIGDIFAHTELAAAPVFEADTHSEKTRPNLKVQDGCNNRCAFCIIPFVRGKSRSLKLPETIASVRELVAAGYREIVLSGINLGRWGRDLPVQTAPRGPSRRLRFVDLLGEILAATTVEKLRVSSVEPMDWSDELIELVANSPRVAKHAHVPLQSGSDRLLRQMHRRYRPWHYADRIRTIRTAAPDAAIGADVMVGFPGETDEDFEQTRELIESLPFTYLHVFTYSSRPGTPSTTMPGQVHGNVARERNRILREIAARKKRLFQENFLGRTLQAITLTGTQNGRTEALTDNYQKLWLEGTYQSNQAVVARIDDIQGEAMLGRIMR